MENFSISFSALERNESLKKLSLETFDVLVTGGGITGAGIALDAASRGLRVAVIEMQDFAGGTSGRSTKLIHGGLRYLKQLEFKLVREVGSERAIIYRNAPHLTRPEPMLLPITKNGSLGKFATQLAMYVYEFLSGVKCEERQQGLGVAQAIAVEPLLKKETLRGGILYYEYRTDDARLTLSVLKEAVNRGAQALNYLQVTGFNYEQGKIESVQLTDQFTQATHTVKAKYVVNAAGPWVDELDSLDDAGHANKLQLTKGIHLVVAHHKLPVKQSVYFDTFDRRMMFVIPRDGKTYMGTTDTFYEGDKIHPVITDEDRAYVLRCVNDYFNRPPLTLTDIESGWAGIRPLIKKPGKKPSEISRRDEIFEWESGLITIAGGKLTGYRKMAQRVVDLIADKLLKAEQRKLPRCSTQAIFLQGGNMGLLKVTDFIESRMAAGLALGLEQREVTAWVYRYGTATDALYAMMKMLLEKEGGSHELPLAMRTELRYAIEHEMCLTPADFFIRRTGMLYFDIDKVKQFNIAVTNYMQAIFGWDTRTLLQHAAALEQALLRAQ